jgi:polysaccharide deacetylase 2 family uncharacterized protein YibQ
MAEKDDDVSSEDLDEESSENDLEAISDLEVDDSQPAQDDDASGGPPETAPEPGDSPDIDSDTDGDSEEDDEKTIGEEYDLGVDDLNFSDNFDDDDDDEESGGKNKLIKLIAASVVGLAVLGGGGWLLFSGSDDSAADDVGGTPVAGMAIPLKGSSRSMLTPPIGKGPAVAGGGGGLKAVPTTVAASGIVAPSVTLAAFAKIPELPPSQPVRDKIDPVLIEQAKLGPLPKVGPNGRKPWKVYARTFDGKDARPRIAIIITGMGLSRAATEAAVSRLPGAVTLAFTPYAQALNEWASIARRSGHEVLLSLPMESATFPIEDPGPLALQSEAPLKKNLERLNRVLGQMRGYVGVISHMGSLFSKDVEKLRPILETLKSRGLMFIDNGATKKTIAPKLATSVGVPRAMTDIVLDRVLTPAAIDAKLSQLERLARERAATVATTGPYPLVIKRLARWAKTLKEKKLALAPISALADIQFLQ